MERVKNKGGGRPSEKEPLTKRYSVNLNASEQINLLAMYELSGVRSISDFIKARIFDKSFRVIKVDRTLLDYYQKLSSIYTQFRGVANNYNQLVVALKTNFAERKALALLYKLERATLQMSALYREIITLTEEFKEVWSQKST